MARESIHRPVLLNEVIASLHLENKASKDLVVLDATYGGGGHSKEILKRFPGIRLVSIDQDETTDARYHANFRNLDDVLGQEKISRVAAIIFDLGFSSDQLDPPAGGPGRGFSFQKEEALDMRMDLRGIVTAATIVNRWSEESLGSIIRGYGEERKAGRIAKAIVEARPLETTGELVRAIEKVLPRRGRINPATKTFQALRIAVNDELGALKEGLEKGWQALQPGGRIAVISFHSLEDRIVKNFFREKAKAGEGILINKKPMTAGGEELKENPRARSAKLRIIEKKVNHESSSNKT